MADGLARIRHSGLSSDPVLPNVEDWVSRRPAGNWSEEFDNLRLSLSGRRILDAACGSGSYGELLSRAGAEVAGIDIEPACISRAARRGYFGVVQGTVTALPFASSSFDYVLLRYALHQIPHEYRTEALGEISRVLIPGGTLVVESTNPRLAEMNHDFRIYPPLREFIERVYPSCDQLEQMILAAGLRKTGVTVTRQFREPYLTVAEALHRSAMLVESGVGPSPWLSLTQELRQEFHEKRAVELVRLYGDGPVPRQWTGYFFLAEKS